MRYPDYVGYYFGIKGSDLHTIALHTKVQETTRMNKLVSSELTMFKNWGITDLFNINFMNYYCVFHFLVFSLIIFASIFFQIVLFALAAVVAAVAIDSNNIHYPEKDDDTQTSLELSIASNNVEPESHNGNNDEANFEENGQDLGVGSQNDAPDENGFQWSWNKKILLKNLFI